MAKAKKKKAKAKKTGRKYTCGPPPTKAKGKKRCKAGFGVATKGKCKGRCRKNKKR